MSAVVPEFPVVGCWLVDGVVVVGSVVGGGSVVATELELATVVGGRDVDGPMVETVTVLGPTVTEFDVVLGGSVVVDDSAVVGGDSEVLDELSSSEDGGRLVDGAAGSRSASGAKVTKVRWDCVVVVSST